MTDIKKEIILDLSECMKVLQKEKPDLLDKFGVKEIAIFGSYSRKEENKSSDIDILVDIKKERKTFDNFMELKFYLSSLFPEYKIDLLIKGAIRKELRTKILTEAVYA